MSLNDKLENVRSLLKNHKQEHLLAFWDELNETQRSELLADIEKINFRAVDRLIPQYVLSDTPFPMPDTIEPAPCYPVEPGPDREKEYAEAHKHGVELIRQNKVAAFTVAGGQGTRLGFDGPKGAYPISPVRDATLFQLFAEFILGANKHYQADLSWYIMTSPQNHADTVQFFEKNDYFGLSGDKVRFFEQGMMPVFAQDGKILLDAKHRISFSPDGHGGSLLALRNSGALKEMAEAGIEYISYIQVDNPLVRVIDPLFVGLHAQTGSEMSSKTITKIDDLEKVGNFVVGDGKVQVIEYSDLPEALAHARDEAGHRKFDAGSIAIHILSRSFVERMTADADQFALPWHRAKKKMPFIDEKGQRIEPSEPNSIKLETFIFDAVPQARNPLILQTRRSEEFSPVKNATGVDSAETTRRDMNRRAARWLENAGCQIPYDQQGEPDGLFEISSLLALDAVQLRENLRQPPPITPGSKHFIE